MPLEDQHEWFGYSRNKFLHNIDTFYYSVKFRNDFRLKSKDPQVEKMRKFFKLQYNYLNGNEDQPELHLPNDTPKCALIFNLYPVDQPLTAPLIPST